MFLYFVVAALAVYCVAFTVVCRREIKNIRSSINSTIFDIKVKLKNHADSIDNLSYEIPNLQAGIEKSDEFLSDIWDRFDVMIDKLLDVRVDNILRERDALETKYRELLQKHNDLADAYDEYKKKHPDRSYIPAGAPICVKTCELNTEGLLNDIGISKKIETATDLDDIPIKIVDRCDIVARSLKENGYSNADIAKGMSIDESSVRPLVVEDDAFVDISDGKDEEA